MPLHRCGDGRARRPAVVTDEVGREQREPRPDEDEAEQDDNCARIYNKSLLYLVSNAFEDKPRIPGFRDGVPLLGLQKSIAQDKEVGALFRGKKAELIIAPNDEAEGDPDRLDLLEAFLHQGPRWAEVASLNSERVPATGEFHRFEAL